MAGDLAGFVACFDAAVKIYSEPELSQDPMLESRVELATWAERVRGRMSTVSVELTDLSERGKGVVTEAVIVGDDVWRLAIAVCVTGTLITEVRAFRDLGAATDWLLGIT
jgi:hypothetical protein